MTNKNKDNFKIVINGAGAAGIAIAKLLLELGFKDLILCDRSGILHPSKNINEAKLEIHNLTNPRKIEGCWLMRLKEQIYSSVFHQEMFKWRNDQINE